MFEKSTHVKQINEFDIIDYKRPIGRDNDWRTSTYRAHYYLNDSSPQSRVPAKFKSSKEYSNDYKLEQNRISDYKQNFLWPPLPTGTLTNPKMGFKHKFIKPFDERKLKFLSRAMRPATSSAHEDYQWRAEPQDFPPKIYKMPGAVASTNISINRGQPGYSKYLDPSATTNRLDYVGMSPQELACSVAAHDNITFWNWSKYKAPAFSVVRKRDAAQCDTAAAKDCPKRRCEFQCQVKHVPHFGLTTEFRSNYLAPKARRREQVFDTTHIRNNLVYAKDEPSPKDTEYRLLTSGERSQKFV